MTLYVGEEIRVTTVIADFDGTVLTDVDVTSVKIATVHDSVGIEVLADKTMTYAAPEGLWFYMWDTAGLTAGTYKAKVVLTGLDGKFSWEFKRIRLARNAF